MIALASLLTLATALVGCTDQGADSGDPAADACTEASGTICTWAGTGDAGFNGEGQHRLDAMFYYPMSITFSPYGKPVIADWNNHKLRMLEDDGTLTTIMGTDFLGDGDPEMADLTEEGADGTTVNLNHPTDQIYLPDGRLLSASWHTHKMRDWVPETGKVHVLLGSAAGFAGDNYEADDDALLNQPKDVLMDSSGDIWILDMRNEMIRKWTTDGTICTIVGNGEKGFCGDGGPGRDACLNFPKNANPEPGGAIAMSSDESLLYIADTENNRIRVYDIDADVIMTLAGTGDAGYSGDGGDALAATLNFPTELHLLDDDTLLVVDSNNHAIRSIDLASNTIDTWAGTGVAGFSGDGGDPKDAQLNRPFHVTEDLDGNIYISDSYNHRIRVVYR